MKTAYLNGQVYTVTNGFCEAFVVEDEHFIYVGQNEKARQLADEFIDLNGKFVTCGFNDSHMHVLGFGHMLEMMNLAECTDSLSHLLDSMRQYIQGHDFKEGQWLRGRGWNNDYFSDTHRFMTRYDLDEVSREVPIVITRACGHVCVVNSKALEILNITNKTPQIEGGHFDIDDNGEPLGIFREQALFMVYDPISKVNVSDLKRMIEKASHEVNRYGITSCQTDDFTNFNVDFRDVLNAYQQLEEEDQLTIKVNEQCQLPTMALLKDFVENNYHRYHTRLFKSGPLKLLGDGSLGARTAYLTFPYADDKTANGISCFSQAQLDNLLGYANQHGMSGAVHCIGDGMMKMVVKSYKKILEDNMENPLRHGIVHCQITDEELLEDFKKYNLLAYIQPIFLDYDITMVESRVGKVKALRTYAFKTLFDTHACGGSDCPVELPNVLKGIQCAVTRKTLKGVGPFVQSETLSVEEAIRLFTIDGAYASFEETSKGSIDIGKEADFVVLDQNPFEVAKNQIGNISVLQTYMNGKLVFQK